MTKSRITTSTFKSKQHFQQVAKLFLDKGCLEVVVGQQDVHKGQDIEVKKEGREANQLIGEHVYSKQELDRDDKEDVGYKLDQPCPKSHVDVDEILSTSSS